MRRTVTADTDPAAATAVPCERRTIVDLLDVRADTDGARPALTDDSTTVSFRELRERARAIAETLAEAGVGHGDRVAVLLPSSRAFVESFLAGLSCGAAMFPINAAAPRAEVRRLLAEVAPHALVAPEVQARALASATGACVAFDQDVVEIITRRRDDVREPAAPKPYDPALIALSSGTLAPPHPIVRTHENLSWEAENFHAATRLDGGDVILCVTPLSHAHGLGNALLASLRSGARLILRSRFLRRETLDLLSREGVTSFPTVPFMVRMLAATDRRRVWDLDALRLCLSAGAPLAPEVFTGFHARFGVPVRQLYGLTEAGSVTLNTTGDDDIDPASVGTPLGTVRVTVEDADGEPVPQGSRGEIVVRSPAAVGGAEHALRTCDVGHWSPRGELVIDGRTSSFINAAGNKVDAAEVEAALRLHPAVADVAVYGVPAPHREEIVAAAVVLRRPCSPEVLRMHCRLLIAAFKVPRVFTFLDALPRSPLGKVSIARLRAGT